MRSSASRTETSTVGVDLLAIRRAERSLESLLRSSGAILRSYLDQDSGCVSYVVESEGRRIFVKAARTEAGCWACQYDAACNGFPHSDVMLNKTPALTST